MESMKVRRIEEEEEVARMISCRLSVSKVVDGNLLVSARDSLKRLHVRLTLSNLGILAVVLSLFIPRCLTHLLVYPLFRLVFGTLYPAYASYKAVRTKNVKEYVKWMMYWIVFALFTCAETFTDVFLSFWFPFYYEIKIILVLWLLSPATKGSSILYRRFVHPALSRREAEIDEALARATEQGYTTVLHLGTRGVNYATTVLMQTAIKGGGGLVQQLKKSYSLSDLTGEKEDENRNTSDTRDEIDLEVEPRRREHVGRRGYSPRRTQSSSNRVEMYFSEVDVDVRQPRAREPLPSLSNIRSSEDISSGYSSGEALHPARAGSQVEPLVRTASVGARTRPKPRSTVKKTPELDEEDSMAEEQPNSRNLPISMSRCFLDRDRLIQLLLALSGIDPRNHDASSQQNERDECLREMFSDYVVDERGDPSTSKESSPEFLDSLSDADDYMKVGQVGVRIEEVDENETGRIVFNSQICRVTSESFSNHIVDADSSLTNSDSTATPYDYAAITENTTSVDPIRQNTENCIRTPNSGLDGSATSMNESSKIDVAKITNEICQNKFEELKVLINNARKTMSAIRGDDASHENPLNSSQEDRERYFDAKHEPRSSKDDDIRSTTLNNSLEMLRVPSGISRSNSDSSGRAGKYHKKPAPKAPASKSEEELGEPSSQKAVRATLVIKTGTLKSGRSDDTFAPRSPKASRRNKKSPKKEGFSKLLTIPKNIFHTAFHNKDDTEKIRSRSASFTSGDEDVLDNLCSGNDDDTLSDELDKTVYEKEEFEEMKRREGGIGNGARKDVYIREMSRSPTRRSPRPSSNTD